MTNDERRLLSHIAITIKGLKRAIRTGVWDSTGEQYEQAHLLDWLDATQDVLHEMVKEPEATILL